MPPLAVIKCFDVSDAGTRGFVACGVIAAVYLFHFQRVPVALGERQTFHGPGARPVASLRGGLGPGLPRVELPTGLCNGQSLIIDQLDCFAFKFFLWPYGRRPVASLGLPRASHKNTTGNTFHGCS